MNMDDNDDDGDDAAAILGGLGGFKVNLGGLGGADDGGFYLGGRELALTFGAQRTLPAFAVG